MIEFKRIRVKNFMSYGNVMTEVDLEQGKVLVRGQNGDGKSSIWLDGISYALYGKPFRKINIPQLINSINQKECLVEIDFDIGTSSYMVRRGMKPGKFEIYIDGVLVKQEAAGRDYQQYLETHILKTNHKTFTQVMILGSAIFKPFMQQSAGDRRAIVEDILDIGVFSSMYKLLKDRLAANKEELAILDIKVDAAKKETKAQKNLIETLTEQKDTFISTLQEQEKALIKNKAVLVSEIAELSSNIEDILESMVNFDQDAFDDLSGDVSSMRRSITDLEDKKAAIQPMTVCPTCLQEVTEDHKHSVYFTLENDSVSLRDAVKGAERDLERMKLLREERDSTLTKVLELKTKLGALIRSGNSLDNQIDVIRESIQSHQGSNTLDLDTEKEKLRELAQQALKLIEKKNDLIKERSIQTIAVGLLKDTGIKASIVKEYLPILNKLINKYLTEFEFFVNFELDENFNETIKSRGRDLFSYESFSEGEKKRIDLAILLAFRHIASVKNSAKINLLVADEVDGGLDQASLEKFVDLVTNLDCNVWLISHVISGTELVNQFDTIAEISKQGDFSVVEIK